MSDLENMWSNTDFPYACLVDLERTEAFRRAIESSVKPGDVVVDVGSGTGILALFAAKAGASKVYAVEIDAVLAACLRQTVLANGLADIIDVIEGNAAEADLPQAADVVIAELIETGLLDEMQVNVINALHASGTISSGTVVIPQAYETYVDFVRTDSDFYGFDVLAPQHLWPSYESAPGWVAVTPKSASSRELVSRVDFRSESDPNVCVRIRPAILGGHAPNGLRISGRVVLTENEQLGPTDTINGDKVLSLRMLNWEGPWDTTSTVEVAYRMGGGFGSLAVRVIVE